MGIKTVIIKSIAAGIILQFSSANGACEDPCYTQRLEWIDKKVTAQVRRWLDKNKIGMDQPMTARQTEDMLNCNEFWYAYYTKQADEQWKEFQASKKANNTVLSQAATSPFSNYTISRTKAFDKAKMKGITAQHTAAMRLWDQHNKPPRNKSAKNRYVIDRSCFYYRSYAYYIQEANKPAQQQAIIIDLNALYKMLAHLN